MGKNVETVITLMEKHNFKSGLLLAVWIHNVFHITNYMSDVHFREYTYMHLSVLLYKNNDKCLDLKMDKFMKN